MIEKLENCPDCNKALDQAEYDGQYCRACGTEPFGFQKAKRARKGAVTPALTDEIEALLADAERQAGTYSDDPRGWHARHRLAMQQLAGELAARFGLKVDDRWDGARVRMGGLAASSTSGVAGALRNWLTAARKRLAKEAA